MENLPDGTFKVNYVVGVETTNGTKNPVTITDTLNKGNSKMYKLLGTYITDSFVLYKVDAQGTLTKQTTFPTYTLTEGTDTKTVKIENLPALNAGEKYLWCYSVLFDSRSFNNSEDGTGIIINRAVAYVDDLKDAGYFQTLTMEQARITKKGEYKPEDGQIEWKITVSVPNPVITGNFLVGYVVKDDLPEGVQIVGKVNVGGTLIDAEEFLNNGKGYTITSADMNGDHLPHHHPHRRRRRDQYRHCLQGRQNLHGQRYGPPEAGRLEPEQIHCHQGRDAHLEPLGHQQGR